MVNNKNKSLSLKSNKFSKINIFKILLNVLNVLAYMF
jgi:hypothetical protein